MWVKLVKILLDEITRRRIFIGFFGLQAVSRNLQGRKLSQISKLRRQWPRYTSVIRNLPANKQTNETNVPTITNPCSDPHQDREALLSVASQSCCCQADRQAEVNLIDLECHKNQHHDHQQMQNCASINQSLLLLLLPK
jgi:hypothetical protein